MGDEAKPIVDGVRASRDGHEFHEAWAARIALELVPPGTTLGAVAIEGFAEEDSGDLSAEAHDIADLVRYRGGSRFDSAIQVETLQFKYSIAQASDPMTAGSMTKTLAKFATTQADFLREYGEAGLAKARFELVTNRPIDADLSAALEAMRVGAKTEGRVARQRATMVSAIGLEGQALQDFARRLTLSGTGTDLARSDHHNLQTLASWSGASDSVTKLRLANLRKLVRSTAGGAGQGRNRLERVDILGALDVGNENDLYPVPAEFPPVEDLIERAIMPPLINTLLAAPRPLLIHAAGGFGKTVLMQAIARHFERQGDIVLLFDGFGAGEWRNPSDGRQLPHRALPHLANLLAARGLCDMLLPSPLTTELVSLFRDRLAAALVALRRFRPDGRIIILLDAADHAGMIAKRTNTDSFAHLLLASLSVSPLDGIVVAASCRTHRRDIACGDAQCRDYPIPGFTPEEIEALVRARVADISSAELRVLTQHCRGNPRLLDSMLRRGRPFDREAPAEDSDQALTNLLRSQIEAARDAAIARGARAYEVRTLLAGLALLPPPVPVGELAAALDLDDSEIEGFVADLFPLIASTTTGLIFRDEPTETLIADMVEADGWAQDELLARLEKRQSRSVYAARALPLVLTELERVDALVSLAFSDQPVMPNLSKVADRSVKYARIRAAAVACARAGRTDDLARIALEAGRIGSATERSDAFLRDYPDVVGVSGDEEAIRRLRDDRGMSQASRHSALAVLDAFQGNTEAARLEADRAISWINRNFRLLREKHTKAVRDQTEAIGRALFIELLDGQGNRIERFLRQYRSGYAFHFASRLLALLERLAHARGAEAVVDAVAVMAGSRSKCPAVLAAAIGSTLLPPEAKIRLIRHFASLRPDPEDEPRRHERDRGFERAVLAAAGQAVTLGLRSEALSLLRHAPMRDVHSHTYVDPWPITGELDDLLRAAAIRGAGRKRRTELLDIAPQDMVAAVAPSARNAGPAAFARAVDRLIAAASERKPKGKASKLGESTVRDWKNLLRWRIDLLKEMVDRAAFILTAAEPDAAIVEGLAEARRQFERAEDYPLRGQKRFIAMQAFELYRWAASQRREISEAAGRAFADYLVASDIRIVQVWLDTTRLLAEAPACHAIALDVARSAIPIIATDTDITTQVNGYGALSIALWPLSIDEARLVFRQGLALADGVGSDDYERIASILAFTRQYGGPVLPQQTVHRLNRLVELNLPEESERFDWQGFGAAYARIDGPRAFAFLGRLTDRDRVDLGTSLPPLLTQLVRQDRLDAELAAGIAGLDPFSSRWDWRAPAFARPIMAALAPSDRQRFADELMVELDRADTTYVGWDALESYGALFNEMLPASASARQRIEQWRAIKPHSARAAEHGPADTVPPELTAPLPIDPETLDRLIEAALDAVDGHRPAAGYVLQRWVPALTLPQHRANLLAATMASAALSFHQKLAFLADARETWTGPSLALDERFAIAVQDLALRHLDEVIAPGEEHRRPINRVLAIAGVTAPAVVRAVITALGGYDGDVSSAFWMASAASLAAEASPDAVAQAVDRFTERSVELLPDAIGDGPWRPDLEAPEGTADSVAGLLWLRLGSRDAASRWRAAHAVRRLCDYGRHDVLDRLMGMFDRQDAGAFQDRSFSFFVLHARLWLLIAAARIALDRPGDVAPHRERLHAIATDEALPHILLRHFAVEALRACLQTLPAPERNAERERLAKLSRPALSAVRSRGHRLNSYSGRPANNPEPPDLFHFDYEFTRHQVDSLGHLFGLGTWEIGDEASAWVRRWDSAINASWECSRPGRRDEDRDSGSESFPERDLTGGYLARHAIYCAAGALSATHPAIIRYDDAPDPWTDWMEGIGLTRADGQWLADGIDLFPLSESRALVEPAEGPEKRHVPEHPLDLLNLIGVADDLLIPERLCLYGDWESHDGLSVIVDSRLLEPGHARVAGHAMQCAPSGFAFLPDEERYLWADDDPPPLMRRWLRAPSDAWARLDGRDPYGCITAAWRPLPRPETAQEMGIEIGDPWGRRWNDKSGQVTLGTSAWGAERGRGQHRSERRGLRLNLAGSALTAFLLESSQAMLVHVRVRKSLDNKEWGEKAYRQQVLTCLLYADGTAEPIWRTPKRLVQAVARMDERSRGEFRDRYDVAQDIGPLRPLGWPRHRVRNGSVAAS